jgi:hypothetical protein
MDQSRTDPLKESFPLFLCVIFEHLDLAAPTKRQLEIARYLQGGPKRLWIAAFRGVGKTWVTVAFVLWLLYCNPQLNILVVSASKAHADNFSIFCKRLLDEVPELAFLRPSGDQRNSNIAFDVGPAEADINPSVRSAGITGQITGSRADVIVADDIEVPNNSATQDQREKLLRRVGEFDDIIKPAETSRIIFLGTPQSDQTMYNSLPRKGFDVRFWPGRFPKSLSPYNGRLAPTIVQELKADPGLPKACGGRGAPTDTRFNDAELWDKEISKGRSDFVLQYMLDTSLSDSDKYPLRLSDMIVLDCDVEKAPVDLTWASDKVLVLEDVPNVGLQGDRIHKPMMVSREAIDWTPYQGKVMSIDPAGRGGDEVGWAVVAYHYGRLYLLDAGGLKGGYQDDNLITLAKTAQQWKVNKLVIEPNFGDGMFEKLLRPHLTRIYPVTVEETERSNTQKEVRIVDTLEPVLNQHRLIVNKGLFQRDLDSVGHYSVETQNRYRLFYQLTRITRDKGSLAKDDRVDALALAVHYWTSQMDRDVERARRDHENKLKDQQVRDFIKSYRGGQLPPGPNYGGRREPTSRRSRYVR